MYKGTKENYKNLSMWGQGQNNGKGGEGECV